MNLWNSLSGMVEVELTSADIHSAFAAMNSNQIFLYEVRKCSDLTVRFMILRKDYKKLDSIARKRGESLKVYNKKGIYWIGKGLLSRPVLLVGVAIFLLFALYIPTKILFIQVEGNERIPASKILDAAKKCGIEFAASRSVVRSEKMKNALLAEIPDLQWAGVNTYGCVAVISVRERSSPIESSQLNGITSIVAARDGFILSCNATKGTLLCAEGQTVTEGQVLISGYTDCGICLQAGQAEGEIIAQTQRQLSVAIPGKYYVRQEETSSKKKISFLFGKKRINLWKDSGIWDSSCGRMYKEYCITLPGDFSLPFRFAVETLTAYETAEEEYPYDVATMRLQDFTDNYLKQQMVSGQILSKTEVVAMQEGVYRMKGDYVCTEMIGKVQREKIGE